MSRNSISAVRAIGAITSKASCGASAGCDELLAEIPRLKNPMRESQTERTPPRLVSHILVRRVRGGYLRQRPTTVEVWEGSRAMRCSVCLGRIRDAIRVAVHYSFA